VAISRQKVFVANTVETVQFEDESGNIGQASVDITRIDKTLPQVTTLLYTPNIATTSNVIAHLFLDEAVAPITGRTQITNTYFTKVYENNTSEFVSFLDAA
jgi:hypothetical protein